MSDPCRIQTPRPSGLEGSESICVFGYTDNTGSDQVNIQLGKARAEAVARFLVELGISRDRIVVRSFGSSRLLVPPPDTPEAQNRRAEVLFRCSLKD
jgi:outer membrane protein OmpA-like peptidoglycan-associated protein